MNIEGITLLNQFVEYLPYPLLIIMTVIFIAVSIVIGVTFINHYEETIGGIFISGSIILLLIFIILSTSETSNFINYPAYTHYIIQIDDKAAWAEIAPNYTIIEEVYPNTGIYEIKQEYKEGNEQ